MAVNMQKQINDCTIITGATHVNNFAQNKADKFLLNINYNTTCAEFQENHLAWERQCQG